MKHLFFGRDFECQDIIKSCKYVIYRINVTVKLQYCMNNIMHN